MDNPPIQNKMIQTAMENKGGYITPPQLSGMINPCTLPPKGWKCTRGFGHSGPCAAIHDCLPIESNGRPMPEKVCIHGISLNVPCYSCKQP